MVLSKDDSDFNAFSHIAVVPEDGFVDAADEPEIESFLRPDPPSDFTLEDLGAPYEQRNPEHMTL